MPEEPTPGQEKEAASLWSAIGQVATGLKDRPLLLFAFGAILVILAASAISLEKFRYALVAILIITLAAGFGWVVLEARKTAGRQTGAVKVKGSRLERSGITTGSMKGGGKKEKTGDVNVHGSTLIDSPIKTGDVKIEE